MYMIGINGIWRQQQAPVPPECEGSCVDVDRARAEDEAAEERSPAGRYTFMPEIGWHYIYRRKQFFYAYCPARNGYSDEYLSLDDLYAHAPKKRVHDLSPVDQRWKDARSESARRAERSTHATRPRTKYTSMGHSTPDTQIKTAINRLVQIKDAQIQSGRLAQICGVTDSTIAKWVAKGLPYTKSGAWATAPRIFAPKSVAQWLQANKRWGGK